MANQSRLRQENMLNILKTIRKSGAVSKPEIAKMTNLTSVTAHNFINELVDKKLVSEAGFAKSRGGRKAALYSLNPDFCYILGQYLGRNAISTSVYNINLERLYHHRIKYTHDYSDRIIALMADEIERAIGGCKRKKADFLGVGISVPGQVNHESGVIVNLTEMPGWNGIALKEEIEAKTGVGTYVDNDNRAAAAAVKWSKLVPENSDFVCISIGEGVGTGILTGGSLFYGGHSNTGEIGHTTIQYDGPLCKCGNRGCIEAIISDYAIVEKAKQAGLDGLSDIFSVIALAKDGNQTVRDILKETGFFTGIAVEHIVKMFDPDSIVIQSNWIGEFPDIQYYIVNNVFARCAWARKDALKILFNTAEDLENTGPPALVLENCFRLSAENMLFQRLSI